MVTSVARSSRTVRLNVFSRSSSSASRPTRGAASERSGRPRSVAHTARCASTARSNPRTSMRPRDSSSTRPCRRRAVPGPTSTSPGSASCWRRAARLTGSPGANAEAGRGVELTPLLERGEGGADGAFGVILVGEWDAEGRHDRVAGELLHRPAVRDDAARHLVEEAGDLAADDLRVAAGEAFGGVDEVDEQHGCELALHTTHGTWEPRGSDP